MVSGCSPIWVHWCSKASKAMTSVPLSLISTTMAFLTSLAEPKMDTFTTSRILELSESPDLQTGNRGHRQQGGTNPESRHDARLGFASQNEVVVKRAAGQDPFA